MAARTPATPATPSISAPIVGAAAALEDFEEALAVAVDVLSLVSMYVLYREAVTILGGGSGRSGQNRGGNESSGEKEVQLHFEGLDIICWESVGDKE